MMAREVLEQLGAAGIKVWAEGDTLRGSSPKGCLTPELQQELQSHKEEILAFLHAGEAVHTLLVPIQPKGSRLPFFGVPGHNGDVFCYVPLAQHLGEDQPFFGLQPPGFGGDCSPCESVPELAAHFVRDMEEHFPEGPYLLGGYCAGGTVAFEVAQQLVSRGRKVALLALFESPFPAYYRPESALANRCRHLYYSIPDQLRQFSKLEWPQRAVYVRRRLARTIAPQDAAARPTALTQIADATIRAVRAYEPSVYPGFVHIFRASQEVKRRDLGRVQTWAKYGGLGHEVLVGPDGCDGSSILLKPFVATSASFLQRALGKVNAALEAGSPCTHSGSPDR